jgi:anthraniloyl-CoA monooxygenase
MIRNQRWVKDNMVLLGDAKATAHFSIGSGTKLAMEDAIACTRRSAAEPTVKAALTATRHARREEVEKTQHAADVSLVWFEHMKRFWDMEPEQFAFGVMTRSKAITYDNLRLRAPEFVEEVDRHFAAQVRRGRASTSIRQARRADVPAVSGCAMTLAEPRGGLAHVHVLGRGRRADDWHLVHYGAAPSAAPGWCSPR